MTLDDPLFPERHWVDDRARAKAEETPLAGTAGTWNVRGTVAVLEHWVRGGSFHRYGLTSLDELQRDGLSLDDTVAQTHYCKPRLSIEGHLREGYGRGTWWSISYQRLGVSEAYGGNAGYSTAEDAAYAALTLIEEHEREQYVEHLVLGVA